MLTRIAPPLQPAPLASDSAWPWVAGSVALYVGASLLIWAVQHRGALQSPFARWLRSPGGVLIGWLARLAWLIGPGYAALLLGLVSPRLMGLSQIRIDAGLGQGAALGVVAIGLLAAAVVGYRRSQPAGAPYSSRADRVAVSARLVVEAGGLQWHWAFYRAVIVAALVGQGAGNPLYLGAWLAAGLAVVEGALSPLLWRDLRTPELAAPRLLRAILLAVTTQVFVLSGNFWLCWAIHAVAVALLEPRLRWPRPAQHS